MPKKDNTKRIEELKALFPKQDFGLTESQSLILAAIACSDGRGMRGPDLRKAGIAQIVSQRDSDLRFLESEKHLIEHQSYWDKSFVVNPTVFLRVALDALLYWPEAFVRVRQAHCMGDSFWLSLVESLIDGVSVAIPFDIRWDRYCTANASVIKDVLDEPAFEAALRQLPEMILYSAAIMRLDGQVSGNILKDSDLDAMDSIADKYLNGDLRAALIASVDGIRFLSGGKCRTDLSKALHLSEWPAAVAAISTLYRGDYDTAVSFMEKALKIRNRNATLKNIFDSPVLAYFQVLAYSLSDSDKSRKKLAQYLNKTFEDHGTWCIQQPGMLLAEILNGTSDAKIRQMISSTDSANFNITSRILVAGIAESRGFNVPFDKMSSTLAIVRHELGDGTPEEKRGWEELFGGPSLLSRLKVKKTWEIALDKLNDVIDKTIYVPRGGQDEDRNDRRIIYVVRPGDYLEIREQYRLKSGAWGKGKLVPYTAFQQGDYNGISDEYDLKVRPRVDAYYYLNVGVVFPVLAGCDRVFHDTYAPENRIEISEELPYLEVKMSKGAYIFSTNVPFDKYSGHYERENVVRRDKLHYSVISLNQIQVNLIQRLSEARASFPEEASEALKSCIGKISAVIEVHSPLLETGSSLEERQGNVMLYFRIIPKSGRFEALLYIRPLENGKLTFFPAKGNAIFYDSDDSGRYQVKRDLRAERQSLDTFFSMTGLDESESEDGLFNLSPEDMLPVIDACRSLSDVCTLEWPEGRALKVIGSLTPQSINVNIHSKEHWFEIEGDAQLPDGQTLSLEQIMSAIASGGYGNGYLKLGESDYVSLSDSLAKYLKRLESVTQSSRGEERISLFQTGALADIVHKSHLGIHTDKAYREKLARIEEAASLYPAIPAGLKAELRDYQELGFRWMVRLDHWGAGACLADDMGLGKTVQTIAFLLYKAASGASLVVAPASVLMNWSRELARFAPSLNVIVLNEQDDRMDALSGVGEYDIVLTTYGLLIREKDALAAVGWNVICLDEAHTIKNRGTKMSDAAMSLKSGSRLILTGTPVQNYLGELWNLFQFLNPGLLGSYDAFSRKFIAPIENSGDKDRRNQLKRMIQPFMLRRTKSEVVEELPEKTEIVRTVPMSAAESVAYEAMRLEAKNELDQDSRVNMNALAAITRLREAACAMPLVKTGWEDEPTKVSALRNLVEDIVSGGNSVLVFSQFTGFLDIVSAMLKKAGLEHFYLQGSTPLKKRQEMVNGFQRAEKPVFLISLKAGGLGLNLTGANYVIHLDPWWNPAIEQQATDRAYRIGQQQNVTVYHLIAANSIEEKILRLHRTKQNLADAILEGTSVSHAITLDELRELIAI